MRIDLVSAIERLALVRLLPNGVPDPAFGDLGNGRVRISFAARVTDGRGVAIASGDRPVVVGTEVSGGIPSMVLYRFTAAGQPDNAFDGNGHLAILSGTRTEGRKLAISSDVVYATGFREVAQIGDILAAHAPYRHADGAEADGF
mgnify:CR=1 FL=1